MVDSTELAPQETHEVFEHYDLADEDQIIAEMSGRVSDKYVYTFKQGGQEVTGLSFAGTNWAVREYAKQGEVIRVVGHPHIIADPTDMDYVIVMVTSQRFAVHKETGKEIPLDNAVGVKRQGKFTEKRKYGPGGELIGHEKVVDPFYIEKAVSKASRNSKQSLIPTETVKKLIARALDSKNGKAVQPKNAQPQQRAPQGDFQGQGQARPMQPTNQASQAPAAPPPAAAPAKAAPAVVPPAAPPAAQVVYVSPPAQAPQPPPQAAAPAPVAAPAAAVQEMPKDVMVQKLDAVLKAVFATQDTAMARQGLHRITGFSSPSDMPVDKIKALGNVLNSVVKKQANIDGNKVVRIADGIILWEGPQVVPVADDGEMF